MQLYAIFGTGGFGREGIYLAEEMLRAQRDSDQDFELCFVDDQPKTSRIESFAVYAWDDFVNMSNVDRYFNVLIAKPDVRHQLVQKFVAIELRPFTIRSKFADVHPTAVVGEGAVLCQFTVVSAHAKVGKFFHLNHHGYVSHDCVVGDYVTFAPGVHCNGTIQIDDMAYVGARAVIHQATPDRPLRIGRNAIVGMGAVVLRSVADGTTVVGNPARRLSKDR